MFTWFKSIIDAIRRWWTSGARQNEFVGVRLVDTATDPTTAMKGRHLVLIGTETKLKWLRFQCPCGCGEVVALNLMQSHTPYWVCERHTDGTLTVHPSVDATTCGSHFWIRKNKIQWV